MFRSYLEDGLTAGAVGGLAFGLFLALVANPLIGTVESAAGDAGSHHAEPVVSGAVTALVSVGGGVLWGLLLGGVGFGVLYYFLEPAIPGTGRTSGYVLAAAGFLTVSGAPWLAAPPRLPGVEASLPTATGLAIYGWMALAGALVCLFAGYTYRKLAGGLSRPLAGTVALLWLSVLVVPAALAPSAAGTGSVPASTAALYRGVVVCGQAGLWLVIATAHARLRSRPPSAGRSADRVASAD